MTNDEKKRAHNEAVKKYDSKNTIQIHLKLNRGTDSDIIARLESISPDQGGKQGYIKSLIRRDISENPST